MTARDEISEWLENWLRELVTAPKLASYDLKRHILSAPESTRLELAALLNPWRPIDEAPKDGTDILVYRPDEGDGGFDAHAGVDYWNKGTWWRSRRDQQPTHFQPLPAPPSEDK